MKSLSRAVRRMNKQECVRTSNSQPKGIRYRRQGLSYSTRLSTDDVWQPFTLTGRQPLVIHVIEDLCTVKGCLYNNSNSVWIFTLCLTDLFSSITSEQMFRLPYFNMTNSSSHIFTFFSKTFKQRSLFRKYVRKIS